MINKESEIFRQKREQEQQKKFEKEEKLVRQESIFQKELGSIKALGLKANEKKISNPLNQDRRVNVFTKSKVNRIVRKKMKVNEDGENDSEYETIGVDMIDENDEELVEIHLRDSLIKSFMVIFTND